MRNRFPVVAFLLMLFLSPAAHSHETLENYTPPPMFEEASVQPALSVPLPTSRPERLKVSRAYAQKLLKNKSAREEKATARLMVTPMDIQSIAKSLE